VDEPSTGVKKSIRVVRIFLGWLVLFVVEGMLRIPDGAIFGNFQV
jgi:hypothetical protein